MADIKNAETANIIKNLQITILTQEDCYMMRVCVRRIGALKLE